MQPTLIYAIQDRNTLEVRYIGKTIRPKARFNRHKQHEKYPATHCSRWLHSIQFNVEFLELETAYEDWAEAEQFWISAFKFLGARLTNLTIGGEGAAGLKRTEEAKAKISAAHKGRVHTAETRAKFSAAAKGKKVSDAVLATLLKASKGRKVSEDTRAKLAMQAGWKHSDEARAKMSLAAKGRVIPESTIRRVIEANTGKVCTEATRAKISAANKRRHQERRMAKQM